MIDAKAESVKKIKNEGVTSPTSLPTLKESVSSPWPRMGGGGGGGWLRGWGVVGGLTVGGVSGRCDGESICQDPFMKKVVRENI